MNVYNCYLIYGNNIYYYTRRNPFNPNTVTFLYFNKDKYEKTQIYTLRRNNTVYGKFR